MINRIIFSIFILFGAQAFAAKPFTMGDCEARVIGAKGKTTVSKTGAWLAQADLKDLELHRMDVSQDNLLSDHVYEGGEATDEVPPAYGSVAIQDSYLTPLERKAFGIGAETQITVNNFHARLKSRTLMDLTLEIFDGDKKIGETRIYANRARLGFQNRLKYYQSYWPEQGYATDLASFFDNHGYVLLPAENNFAFVFPQTFLDKPINEAEYLEFMVFSMRECPEREALLMKDYVFPLKDAPTGSKNICLDNLGLKLVMPYRGED